MMSRSSIPKQMKPGMGTKPARMRNQPSGSQGSEFTGSLQRGGGKNNTGPVFTGSGCGGNGKRY